MKNICKNIVIHLLLLFSLIKYGIAQEYEHGKIHVIINDSNYIPIYSNRSLNIPFNQLLDSYGISNITQPYYFAKTHLLKNLFE